MKIEVRGKVAPGITAKDIILAIIGKTTMAGGTGHVVEFCGEAIRDLSMEGRMDWYVIWRLKWARKLAESHRMKRLSNTC